MSNAKLQIYGEVLKQLKPFKASAIHQATALSRSLISYHLSKLIDDGYLEKDGSYYLVVARNDLLDAVTNSSTNNVSGLLEDSDKLFIKIVTANVRVSDSVALRNAKAPGYKEFQNRINLELDAAIGSLRSLRRYHNAKNTAENKALAWVENNLDDLWPRISEDLQSFGIDRKMLEAYLTEAGL